MDEKTGLDWEPWKTALTAVATFVVGGGLTHLWSSWRKSRQEAQVAEQGLREGELKIDQAAGDWQMRTRQDEEKFILEVRKKLVADLKGDLDNARERLDWAETQYRKLYEMYNSMQGEHEKCQAENQRLTDQVATLTAQVTVLQAENRDSRLKVMVLERAVKKMQSDSDEAPGGSPGEAKQ